MQVIVDGLLTSYERSGKGRTIVLLHGWGDRARGLTALRQALSRSFDVVAPDLPGMGDTQAPEQAWGLTMYAQFMADFLRKIGVGEPYALIGHSNGGAIAIRGVATGTLGPQKLVLLASSGIRGEKKGRAKVLRYVVKGGKLLTAPLPQAVRQRLRRKVYQSVGSDLLVAEHLEESFKRIVADDVRADATNIHAPTLLIYGDDDTATPVRYGEMLHKAIEGSVLKVLHGTGHFVHLDRPVETVTAIEEFLA